MALALAALAAGCARGPREEPLPVLAAPGTPDPLASLRLRGTPLPEEADLAAHDLAAAALAGRAADARAQQERLDTALQRRASEGEEASGLAAWGQHLVDATEPDEIARRRASAALLRRDGVDPALERQLELEIEDDPLALAATRIGESRRARVARGVNAFSEAAGRSMSSVMFAPVRLAQAAIGVAVAEHMDEPISVQERQALAHWKQYVETHPESPETPGILERIERMQGKWFSAKRERSVRAARLALERDQDDVALVLALRALEYAPEDPEAVGLRNEAERRVERRRARHARTLLASPDPPADAGDPAAEALARALLDPNGDVPGAAAALLASGGAQGPLADEARFAEALAAGERGEEAHMWELFGRVSGETGPERQMARHARQLAQSPDTNPYSAFRHSRVDLAGDRAGYVLLGPLAQGARDRDLPRPVEYLLESTTLLGSLGGIPSRLVQTALAPPPSQRAPAVYARRYLDRHPDGQRAAEVRAWLIDYELESGRKLTAYELAQESGSYDDERLAELEREAAAQMLEAAKKQKREDVRLAMLGQIAEEHPETEAGREAAKLAHREMTEATIQRIRISRGFLEENPAFAGDAGVGLRPELLDGRADNGELHEDGVRLVGGRVLEFSLLPLGGGDRPEILRREVSSERLARLVALLEETATRNALVDPLNEQAADARRDHFFERAKLGVADVPDTRATASSSFAFVGVREKYGMVRSRESILPVELVVQGSFPDLGLGAFPRLRMPKTTPDAVLYR